MERTFVLAYKKYLNTFNINDFFTKFIGSIEKRIQPIPSYEHFKDLLNSKSLRIVKVSNFNIENYLVEINGNKESAEIGINPRFLAILWCICFNSIVEYDYQKAIVLRKNGDNSKFPIGDYEVSSARELLDFALSLINSPLNKWGTYKNSTFDAFLPNPFIIETNLEYYILKANTVFIEAFVFIVLHELAHYHYDYLDSIKAKPEDEICCDFFAAFEQSNEFKQCCDDINTHYFGMVTAFIAIELIDQLFNRIGDSETHPSNLTRIDKIIDYSKLPEDSMLFEYSAYGLSRSYQYEPKIQTDGFHYETAKEYYIDALNNALAKQNIKSDY
ncbi:hypothetical protein QA601_01835 [Chitinispirillales bacterium ANBcel5]|uniref:hypothetical protein n=1 Tax=Cellulosispirillum alkaliphilum TaxID=3039283 RepID=UPI002A544EDE|nr:hypothetical protein [Chitinispirillales bacterium ANBcel5]